MTAVGMPEARPLAGEREVTLATAQEHNLTAQEYDRILDMLGRTPSFTELGIFSALWSEHCSYKHSRPLLHGFPTEGPAVIQGPGENAGVLRLPNGWAVAFKIESHNHPSAVEPYQGAATGVGGILRDVFTMGARPVALLNSLRLGPLDEPRNRYLFAGIVRGVGDYGNCVGIPTLAGEVNFAPGYSGNPLVNAMAVGLLREDDLIRARAEGVGNILLAVGARTGRDGIHGASFASEGLTEASERRRPQVQVGDPFTEKLLLEASLELIGRHLIVAIQDMGAAGLTSSSAEMAARGGVGVELDTDRVPIREAGMTPYEILLSESQERMLVVATPERVDAVVAVCRRWELDATPVGQVTDDGLFRVVHEGVTVAAIPGRRLVDDCPVYHPEARESRAAISRRHGSPGAGDADPVVALERLMDAPSIASKRWVFEQYDSTVRGRTVDGPGGDAGVILVPGESFGLAMTVDCNARWVALDPYEGGKAAVAEAARNLACAGAVPLGVTDCLNFGNPEKPEVFFQFREACRGIADACRAFGTPVTGGNVSFYNENPTGAIDPTPTVGMVGLLRDATRRAGPHFGQVGDLIVVAGPRPTGHLGGSAYWAEVLDFVGGPPPPVDLVVELRLQRFLLAVIEAGIVHSAHDLSDGGLAVALAEACLGGPYATSVFGADVRLGTYGAHLTAPQRLFGEDQGRALLSLPSRRGQDLARFARDHGVPLFGAGRVTAARSGLTLRLEPGTLRWDVRDLRRIYMDAIPRRMQAVATAAEGA